MGCCLRVPIGRCLDNGRCLMGRCSTCLMMGFCCFARVQSAVSSHGRAAHRYVQHASHPKVSLYSFLSGSPSQRAGRVGRVSVGQDQIRAEGWREDGVEAPYSPAHELTCASWPFSVQEKRSSAGPNNPGVCTGLSGMVLSPHGDHLFKGPNMHASMLSPAGWSSKTTSHANT